MGEVQSAGKEEGRYTYRPFSTAVLFLLPAEKALRYWGLVVIRGLLHRLERLVPFIHPSFSDRVRRQCGRAM